MQRWQQRCRSTLIITLSFFEGKETSIKMDKVGGVVEMGPANLHQLARCLSTELRDDQFRVAEKLALSTSVGIYFLWVSKRKEQNPVWERFLFGSSAYSFQSVTQLLFFLSCLSSMNRAHNDMRGSSSGLQVRRAEGQTNTTTTRTEAEARPIHVLGMPFVGWCCYCRGSSRWRDGRAGVPPPFQHRGACWLHCCPRKVSFFFFFCLLLLDCVSGPAGVQLGGGAGAQ